MAWCAGSARYCTHVLSRAWPLTKACASKPCSKPTMIRWTLSRAAPCNASDPPLRDAWRLSDPR